MAISPPPWTYVPIPAINKWLGKRLPLACVVNHVAQCDTLDQLDSWFQQPQGVASANAGIGQDGTIHIYVDPIASRDAPYANGIVDRPAAGFATLWAQQHYANPNYFSGSIEYVGWSGYPSYPFVPTEAQLSAAAWLTAYWCDVYGVPTDEAHLFAHCELDSVTRAGCNGWTRETWLWYEEWIAYHQQTHGGT
jgi:hypothetical protein